MKRRTFLQCLGIGAAAAAAGVAVENVARKPPTGWAESKLNVGDVLTVEGAPQKFIVVNINGAQKYLPVWS